jgi:hypothetical protein
MVTTEQITLVKLVLVLRHRKLLLLPREGRFMV